MRAILASTLLPLAMAGCAGTTATSSSPPPEVYSAFRELTEAEKKIIADGVAKGLKDPDSAHFQWNAYPVSTTDSVFYCAKLNSKNSYGGYVGFSPYIAEVMQPGGKIRRADLISTDSTYPMVIEAECKKRGLRP